MADTNTNTLGYDLSYRDYLHDAEGATMTTFDGVQVTDCGEVTEAMELRARDIAWAYGLEDLGLRATDMDADDDYTYDYLTPMGLCNIFRDVAKRMNSKRVECPSLYSGTWKLEVKPTSGDGHTYSVTVPMSIEHEGARVAVLTTNRDGETVEGTVTMQKAFRDLKDLIYIFARRTAGGFRIKTRMNTYRG